MHNFYWLYPCFWTAALITAHFSNHLPQQPLNPQSLHEEHYFPKQSQLASTIDNGIDIDDASHGPLFALHRDLVNINSISGHEHAIGIYLEEYLQTLNYTVERQTVAPLIQAACHDSTDCPPQHHEAPLPRFNLLAHPPSRRNTLVLLTTHIDTVPPFTPYSTRPPTHQLWGRGSVDAKACIASQIFAAQSLLTRSLIPADSLSHLFVVGEEVGGDGMQRANDLNLSWSAVIFGEPTELRLASGHKGMLIFRLRAQGKAAHSGYPWLGASATRILVRALAALQDRMPLPYGGKYGNSTLNIGTIEGGVAANVMAENATASVGIRLAGGKVEDVKKLVLETVAAAAAIDGEEEEEESSKITIEFYGGAYPPIDIDHDVPGFNTNTTTTVNYGTDIPNLKGKHKRYLYGPGSILVAHSDHEFLDKRDLVEAVGGYEKIILHALSLGAGE